MEVSQYGLSAFEIHITGFTNGYKETKLAMGAYVEVTNGTATEYSYIQSGVPIAGEKYCFISYGELAGEPTNK